MYYLYTYLYKNVKSKHELELIRGTLDGYMLELEQLNCDSEAINYLNKYYQAELCLNEFIPFAIEYEIYNSKFELVYGLYID